MNGRRPGHAEGHASPFAVRGVIEGFYGNPWTHDQRLELMDFIAARGMNTFVYAPKDDPLMRSDWRAAYDGAALTRLAALIGHARRRGLTFTYCLSPGLSIRYSDPADAEALVAKLESVGALGTTSFGLLLDDIPAELQHEADEAAFGDLIDAQVALIGRLAERLGPARSLIVCPTAYWGVGDEVSLRRLGEALDPRIDLFWTGRAVCSPTLDLADATTFARTARRPPVYWDNYPVNDAAMTHELHVGPYEGRDPDLWRSARGIIANGMELFESSKIPFATIADYLRAPAAYEPESSWQVALRDVAGASDAEAYTLFADCVRSSCLSRNDAPVVTSALEAFTFRRLVGDEASAAAELGVLADGLLAAADHLLRGPVRAVALVEEARPWIEAFEIGAQALRRMADLAREGRLGSDGRLELQPLLDRLRAARVRVFGDALEMALADLTGSHPRPGHFVRA